jgi:hypothetical protein
MSDAPAPALAPAVLGGAGRHDDRKRSAALTADLWTGRSTDEPAAAQHKRAHESGRGRNAQPPWQIPWRGWKDILWRTYEQLGEDRLRAVAAGVVFYGLLAVFPAVTALLSRDSLGKNTFLATLMIALFQRGNEFCK